ncbi:trehalase family glycosidase [Aegicerativicinus sediminis]|uniref:trehalase family glycosidase n=1 Tax=Aegicerativicinus sediminis TaxID=2893202 RepID=UPI001E496B8B|nr:trehalase family glycosidase [Aegicerativicinus sediminis]
MRQILLIVFTTILLLFNCKEDSAKEINSSLEVNIHSTLERLLNEEDTDGDTKITIDDTADKSFKIQTIDGNETIIEGTMALTNLLQELVLASAENDSIAIIELDKLNEPPVDRISRMIKDYYWDGLTRHLDEDGIQKLIKDTKNQNLVSQSLRIYVPHTDTVAFNYFKSLEEKLPIKTIKLPENITSEFVKSINNEPGILSLKLVKDGNSYKGVPFVVPGGRFNEMYGWDSYFESIGLLLDERVDLAKGMAENFQYEINNYGKILNANRSYYLTRTQPPFYSSLISEVYKKTNDTDWLKDQLITAIKEYETVWMVMGKRLSSNGLNRYLAEGIGVPPETEEGHFDEAIHEFAVNIDMSPASYIKAYSEGEINDKNLDEYFIHDRTMRESGHDTSYRMDGFAADLNLVELNAMLYKYENDFRDLIKNEFGGSLTIGDKTYTSDYWQQQADKRRASVNEYLWNEERGLYFDYNVETKSQTDFVSATTLAPLWANLASKEQADKLVKTAIPLLKEKGGLAASTEDSRGAISEIRPQRQWDYPNGWAPHQIMAWRGLINYGYEDLAQELIYRWLYMITRNAVDYNGTIPEKYDVVEATHKVFAEYGNVGTDFQYITKEGFGWMNASYQYGLSLLKPELRNQLNQLKRPDTIF